MLHFTGGWSWKGADDKALVDRVAKGLKPAGITWGEIATLVELEEYAKSHGLITHIKKVSLAGQHELGISCRGTFGKLFDLDALVRDYARAGFDASNLSSLAATRLASALKEWSDREKDDPVTGLLLGYPVETTWAVMAGNVLPRYREATSQPG